MRLMLTMILSFYSLGCASISYDGTVDQVNLEKFMGRWYVIAGRLSFLEDGAHNAVEEYSWNSEKEQININFYFNKDSFDGEIKRLPQTAWVANHETNAHWKVRPFWPFKFDYLVIGLADDYSWTAIGVPSGRYLWIMSREWDFSREKIEKIIEELNQKGYPIDDIKYVPQKWHGTKNTD